MNAGSDAPIAYIERTRAYYAALGYPPYRWAQHDDVPFAPLHRPVGELRLLLVTTAARFDPALGDQGPGAPYNAAAKFYRVYRAPVSPPPDLRISHVAYDRNHATAADPNAWLPIRALHDAVARGELGSVADELVGLPTDRSQRATLERDAPEVLDACTDQRAELALFVPNCPVCHQSVSLVARVLESRGIPTVVLGCASDVVEQAGVARFVFSDFPLGHSAGKPFDPESQRRTLQLALDLFASASRPRTTVVSPQRWSADAGWKRDYLDVSRLSPAELARRREEFAQQKTVARGVKEAVR